MFEFVSFIRMGNEEKLSEIREAYARPYLETWISTAEKLNLGPAMLHSQPWK